MKVSLPILLFSILFLFVGCREGEAAGIGSTTAVSQVTVPTGTAVPPTTTTEPTPTVMETAVPPFTQGRIIFWWHPVLIPSETDQPYPEEPRSGLYQALPGSTPNDWTVQPLLEDIGLFPQTFLSPDQSKLAILVRDYSNGRISDFSKIHIFSFTDGSLLALDNEEYLNKLSWLPDSQAVIYSQRSNIELARLDGSPPTLLTDNPPKPIEGEPYERIGQLIGSPDGLLLALHVLSGTGLNDGRIMPTSNSLTFFNTNDKTFTLVTDVAIVHSSSMLWSPDSQWLAFTGDQNQGLFVVNVNSLMVQKLIDAPTLVFPAWSPDSQQLAIALNGTISVWDVASQTIREVTSKDYVSEPAWSPDGSLIAAIYQEAGESGIVLVDPASQVEEILNNGVRGGKVIWSPDGEWLAGEQFGYGLYIANKETGELHLVLDTAGFPSPSSIMWLP